MSMQPEQKGMGGPQRSGPSSQGPVSEPASRGAAYTTPPPADKSPVPAKRSNWWVAPVIAVVLLGAGAYVYNSSTGPAPVASQTSAAAVATLAMAAADIDHQATDLAKQLIAAGTIPLPDAAGIAAAPAATSADTSAAVVPEPTAATPVAKEPTPAPVVHRPKREATAAADAPPPPAPVAETEKAVRQILEQAPLEVRTAIAEGRTSIYSLHVVDDVAEDGDVVEIMVDGKPHGMVTLSNTGQDILIPLPSGTTANISAVARQDGGGGVTFGVLTSAGELRSTVMSVGQSDNWSVSIP